MRSIRMFQTTRFTPASNAVGLIEAIALPDASRIAILTSFGSGFVFAQKSMIAPAGGFVPMNTSWPSKLRLDAMRHMVAGRTSNAWSALSAVFAFICSSALMLSRIQTDLPWVARIMSFSRG